MKLIAILCLLSASLVVARRTPPPPPDSHGPKCDPRTDPASVGVIRRAIAELRSDPERPCSNCHPGKCTAMFTAGDSSEAENGRTYICNKDPRRAPPPVPCSHVADALQGLINDPACQTTLPNWSKTKPHFANVRVVGGQNFVKGPNVGQANDLYVAVGQNGGAAPPQC